MRTVKSEVKHMINELKAVEYRNGLRNLRMRIAPDGFRYEEDNLNRELFENEVEIIQFIRPNGKRILMTCEVPLEIKEMAKDMILSAEELTTGRLAIYSRFKDDLKENERIVLATNDNDPETNPTAKLIEVIKIKYGERKVVE